MYNKTCVLTSHVHRVLYVRQEHPARYALHARHAYHVRYADHADHARHARHARHVHHIPRTPHTPRRPRLRKETCRCQRRPAIAAGSLIQQYNHPIKNCATLHSHQVWDRKPADQQPRILAKLFCQLALELRHHLCHSKDDNVVVISARKLPQVRGCERRFG